MMKKVFTSISLIFMLSSCYTYKEVTVQGIEGFSIKKIDKKEMHSEVVIKIKNPNHFSFNIYSGKANVTLGKIPLGTATLQKKVHIPANSTGTYTLALKTSFEKISMQDIINSISFSDFGKIKTDGYIKVGKTFYRKKIHTTFEGNPLSGWNLTPSSK